MNSFREILVQQGPIKLKEEDFPKDDRGRKFFVMYYKGHFPNGETYERKWSVYSKHSNSIFCLPCKIFSIGKKSTKLTENGYSDWKHITSNLKDHEKSVNHKECFIKWMDLAARMKKNETVNECNLKKIKLEVESWQNILKRIISVIKFLASHSLAFQGHTDKLFFKGNGNFLGLVEMISEFDPILQEHVRKIKSHEVSDHYLGKNIENQIIQLLGSEIKKSIILNCQNAKYYSIIMGCTTNVTHQEQLTLVLRF
ncbi:zinc finger MYM-type protein 1-like [Hydra vulgaris]|uniref:Zinc finger MYM-type protein 1-like n=1 Tax=Hydra vulgaris TaxID=6087 RepID=A0ABM4BNT3_HYDVU